MTRQLVVLLDGTGNRFSHRPTNIVRLLRSLPQDTDDTLSYYDQGVGTFGLKETMFEWQKTPSRLCGLAFGWGLRRTVEGAYRFLAQNWTDDSEIFIFGFSRGAYAARALAALIRALGIVRGHEAHLFDYAWAMLLARKGKNAEPDFELQARFRATFGRRATVKLLGLFDTVKSVGWVYDPVVIPYTARNPIVNAVRHAVSMSERRCFFRQNLWSAAPTDKTDLKEVWFAGVHSDIGGGYPPEQAQLALVAHKWMLGEALALGLRFDAARCKKQIDATKNVSADFSADMHDSMTPAWKVAEWVPRMVWSRETARRTLEIGAMPPLRAPRPRSMPDGALIHRSVEQRMAARADFTPSNLPNRWQAVDDDPRVMWL